MTCTYQAWGPEHTASHYFQDVQHLLKHARFIPEKQIYRSVTVYNYSKVRDLSILMRADAVEILKDEFKRLHPPSQLSHSLRNEQRLLGQHTKKGDRAATPKNFRTTSVRPKPSSKNKL